MSHSLGALLGALIALGVARALGDLGTKTEPIAGQLEAVFRQAAARGLEPVNQRDVDLTGTGDVEHLVIFRPQPKEGERPGSDELRIYDTDGNRLRLRYSLQPQLAKGVLPYEIKLLGSGPFDSTDRTEVIMSVAEEYADGRLPRPVALLWNAGTQHYELRPLLTYRPYLQPLRGYWAQAAAKLINPVNIALANGEIIRGAWAAQAVAAGRSHLAAAYPVDKGCHGCDGVWEFKTFCLNFRYLNYPLETAPENPLEGRPRYRGFVRNESDLDRQLREALHRDYCE